MKKTKTKELKALEKTSESNDLATEIAFGELYSLFQIKPKEDASTPTNFKKCSILNDDYVLISSSNLSSRTGI